MPDMRVKVDVTPENLVKMRRLFPLAADARIARVLIEAGLELAERSPLELAELAERLQPSGRRRRAARTA